MDATLLSVGRRLCDLPEIVLPQQRRLEISRAVSYGSHVTCDIGREAPHGSASRGFDPGRLGQRPGDVAGNDVVGTRSARNGYVMRMLFVSPGDRPGDSYLGPVGGGTQNTVIPVGSPGHNSAS